MMSVKRWVWIVSLALSVGAHAQPEEDADFVRLERAAASGWSWQRASSELDVGVLSIHGRSVAHLAARFGRNDWLARLPRRLLTAPDDMDNQPVHSASWSGRLESLKWLADHGASLAAANRQGWQPLHMALFNGHEAMARWLLQQGVPVDGVTQDGWTPLGLAVAHGACSLVPILRKAGADASRPVVLYGRKLSLAELAELMEQPECLKHLK